MFQLISWHKNKTDIIWKFDGNEAKTLGEKWVDKSLHCCNKFYHIFVNELVFIFFFFKYQNHFDMKRSPFKNSGNSWGEGGSSKTPLERKILGG